MSDNSLKAYSAGVRRVELDYDSIDFYASNNIKGGSITARYDSTDGMSDLYLETTTGRIMLEAARASTSRATVEAYDGFDSEGQRDTSAYMSVDEDGSHTSAYVMVNAGLVQMNTSYNWDDGSKMHGTRLELGESEIDISPKLRFGNSFFGDPYIDASGGTFRLNSAVIPGTSVTYSGISLMADNKINIYFSGQLKHQFRADGTKTGGSIEIDGKTLGMSPIDSPRVLFLDVIPDVEAKSEGTEVRFDANFAKAMSGYKVFPNKNVEIEDITPEGFTVVGEGKVDLLIIGRRVKYEDTYWQEMPTEEEENEQTDTGNEAKYYKRTESGTTADSSFRPHFRRYPKRYTAPADSGGTAGGASGEGTGRKS
jgi:hypothetical protein